MKLSLFVAAALILACSGCVPYYYGDPYYYHQGYYGRPYYYQNHYPSYPYSYPDAYPYYYYDQRHWR